MSRALRPGATADDALEWADKDSDPDEDRAYEERWEQRRLAGHDDE